MADPAIRVGRVSADFPEDTEARRSLFLRLARENESLMLRVALRLCNGNRDRAADCVQEAIVSSYKAFVQGRFTEIHNFRPWIMRILTNTFLLDERKNKRMVVTENVVGMVEDLQYKQGVSHNGVPDDEGFSEELQQALSLLPPEQLACVTLVDIEEMDYAQAAQTMGIPIGTVRSRLARARMKLANEITRLRQVVNS